MACVQYASGKSRGACRRRRERGGGGAARTVRTAGDAVTSEERRCRWECGAPPAPPAGRRTRAHAPPAQRPPPASTAGRGWVYHPTTTIARHTVFLSAPDRGTHLIFSVIFFPPFSSRRDPFAFITVSSLIYHRSGSEIFLRWNSMSNAHLLISID